jgi:uncharacterized protein YjiS (DUF1127 family)
LHLFSIERDGPIPSQDRAGKESSMSICEDAPASAAAGRESLLSKFSPVALLDAVTALYGTWRNRRLVASMRDFDESQLADIGLSRHDVERALSSPGADPTPAESSKGASP